MSCPLRVGQARAQDSLLIRVFHDLLNGAANAPLFYFHPGRTHAISTPVLCHGKSIMRRIYYVPAAIGRRALPCLPGLHKDGGHGPEIW